MFRTTTSTNSSTMRSGATLCSEATVEQLQRQVDAGLRLLEQFEWLVNSFVLDFFHESHWSTLPGSWQTFLGDIGQEELAGWLDPRTSRVPSSQPVPLSLLALKQALRQLALDRAPVADLSQVASFLHASDSDNESSDVNDNQLEKLEAARSAYLCLPYLSLPFLTPFLTFPYLALLCLTLPYLALLSLT